MHIIVGDKTVKENIRSFLELLRKAEAKREGRGAALFEKSYRAFLNRATGMLVFLDAFKDQPDLSENEWKPLFIDYIYDPDLEGFRAEVFEISNKNESFKFTGLSSSAIQAIKKTITILNRLSFLVRGEGSDLITKIHALCKVQIDVESSRERNILIASWHSLDRLGAEKALKGKSVGTFLFREDYYAKLLGDQLSKQLAKNVKCITLTVVEPDNKIADFTLVHIDHQWRVYSDVRFYNTPGFSEIEDLLKIHFNDILKEPLYHSFDRLAG